MFNKLNDLIGEAYWLKKEVEKKCKQAANYVLKFPQASKYI